MVMTEPPLCVRAMPAPFFSFRTPLAYVSLHPMEKRLLMGPGPSNVPEEVLQAMARPTIGHLDPLFLTLLTSLQEKLRRLFRTENELTLPLSGTGSAGMEAAVLNVVEEGDEAVVGVSGVFGERLAEISRRAGAIVRRAEAPWGEQVPYERFKEQVEKCKRLKLIAVVHAETSTGVRQDIEGLSELAHERGALLVVDAVTSLGGIPVETDAWGADIVYSGTQKALSAPPGLAPITFSPRAVKIIRERKTPCRSWYLDVSLISRYFSRERVYHHTAPVNALYGLDKAVDLVLTEGLESRWERHRLVAEALAARLEPLGFRYLPPEGSRLWTLHAFHLPEGTDEPVLRAQLLSQHGIEIGAGLGPLQGKIVRIGTMGHTATIENAERLAAALRDLRQR